MLPIGLEQLVCEELFPVVSSRIRLEAYRMGRLEATSMLYEWEQPMLESRLPAKDWRMPKLKRILQTL
jgi:hypothetical protein